MLITPGDKFLLITFTFKCAEIMFIHFSDPPTIQQVIPSAVTSWIGQTVTLKCVSDGVPTPTLTWYKPDGSQISSSTATEYTVNVKMNVDQDFGDYKCNANNGLTPADDKIVNIKQISKCCLFDYL